MPPSCINPKHPSPPSSRILRPRPNPATPKASRYPTRASCPYTKNFSSPSPKDNSDCSEQTPSKTPVAKEKRRSPPNRRAVEFIVDDDQTFGDQLFPPGESSDDAFQDAKEIVPESQPQKGQPESEKVDKPTGGSLKRKPSKPLASLKIKKAALEPPPKVPVNVKYLPQNCAQILASRTELSLPESTAVPSMTLSSKLEDVGGLDKHISSVKESIVLPLLYPKFCADYNITSSRGVLFHGPPGTGKTLLARALAHECSDDSMPIAFFHFNSADILSKWVGEGESRIREIFDAARVWQPSLVFFDEIDGLAPSRIDNDRPSASLVSTLLASLDGFSNLGRVLVVGSTNRLDAIDPALRRPGRFDQELLFSLPTESARLDILKINTRNWNQDLPNLPRIAKLTSGFCGADLSLLCSKAAKHAFSRVYPDALDSSNAADVDLDEVEVEDLDFLTCLKKIKPAAQTLLSFDLQPLAAPFSDLLSPFVDQLIRHINCISQVCLGQSYSPPNVVVLEGKFPVTSHRVLSASLHSLDSHKITLIDHSALATSDDLSGSKELSRILNTEGSGTQPELFVFSSTAFFEQHSSLSNIIRCALSRPVGGASRTFLFTCARSSDLDGLLAGVEHQVVSTHKVFHPAVKSFLATFLDLVTSGWESSPLEHQACLELLGETVHGWPYDHIFQFVFQLEAGSYASFTELLDAIRECSDSFSVPEMDTTEYTEL